MQSLAQPSKSPLLRSAVTSRFDVQVLCVYANDLLDHAFCDWPSVPWLKPPLATVSAVLAGEETHMKVS
jgi:hypothetical protein